MKTFMKGLGLCFFYYMAAQLFLLIPTLLLGYSDIINGLSYGAASLVTLWFAKKNNIVRILKRLCVVQAVVSILLIALNALAGKESMQFILSTPFVITTICLCSMHLKNQK